MMKQLVLGYFDEQGLIKLPENVHLTPGQRVIVAVSPSTFSDTALLSEPALARDWNRPEEDEAWSHLQQRT